MKLEVLPAKKGDCLLLHCGTDEAPALVLIDGGPAGVWQETLKPRLMEIKKARRMGRGTPLTLDLVIVSHIDDDHINGIIGLFEHIQDQRLSGSPPDFAVGRLWHNSFDRIVGNDETEATGLAARFGTASLNAEHAALAHSSEGADAMDAAKVLASVPQGDRLRSLAAALGVEVNPEFDGGLIQTGAPPDADEALAVEFIVAGPRREDLIRLQLEYDRWLSGRSPDDRASSALAALEDISVTNLSSVVLLVRDDESAVLLTGDARSDHVIAGLAEAELLDGEGRLRVNTLKMPHHGSIRNVDADFVKRVRGDVYVLSGDGKHGNPDRQTVQLLLDERQDAAMAIHLTYPLADIDAERERDHLKEQRKRQARGLDRGRDWDDERDSLAAILAPPPAGVVVIAGR